MDSQSNLKGTLSQMKKNIPVPNNDSHTPLVTYSRLKTQTNTSCVKQIWVNRHLKIK